MTAYERSTALIKKYGNRWAEHAEELKEDSSRVSIGDLFYTSWGYDQTNYDYIIIVELSKTGKTAVCQCAKAEHVGYSHFCNEQKPIKKPYGDKFRMKVQQDANNITLRGSYPFCNGSRENMRRDWFYPTSEKQTFFETDPQFGH